MECSQPVPVQKSELVVQHWTRDGVMKRVIPIVVYPDDSVVNVLTKIAHELQKTSLPYAWRSRPLLFTPTGSWKGYNVNPFKAEVDASANGNPTISYTFNEILRAGVFNIAFKDDLPKELQSSSYYFPDLKLQMRSLKTLQKEDALLSSIWESEADAAKEAPYEKCIFTRVEYQGTIKSQGLALSEIFDMVRANSRIPFVQWVDDRNRVLYKVYEHHKIPTDTITQWMKYERLPITDGAIVLYSPFKNNFTKCFIDHKGDVSIIYNIDSREQMDLDVINTHHADFVQHLTSVLKAKVHLKLKTVSMRTDLSRSGVTLKALAAVITNLLPVFHVVKLTQSSLEFIYKRSSNYVALDVTQFIRSLLTFGNMSAEEIVQQLVHTHGFTVAEATSYYEQASQIENVATNKQIETGVLLKVSPFALGFHVVLENSPSLEEARCALHWLRSCVAHTSTKVAKVAATKQPVAARPPPKPASPPPPPAQATKVASPSSSEKSLSDSLSVGGGIGKEFEGHFLTMLQQADPKIFVDTNNYARSCMVTNFRQPVVLTKQEKEELDKTEFGQAIDNFYEYGSDPNKKNVFFCPRIWCPKSKVPMTPEQYEKHGKKCPKGEDPILPYKHDYWDNDPNVIHHIGFHASRGAHNLCLPCCMRRAQTKIQTKLKECAPKDASTSASASVPPPKAAPVDLQPPLSADVKQDYYLFTQPAPLAKGRYGVVPKPLHDALFPNISHAMCSKTLTSQECLVRRGIDHADDSFLSAIASGLGMVDKKTFLKWLSKQLDPLTFITLENGHVLSLFVRPEPLIPSDHKRLVKRWKEWAKSDAKYISLFQVSDLVEKTQNDLTDADKWRLSREIMCYDAYERFMEYTRSAEVKNPYLYHDVLRRLGILLLLWEKQDNDTAFLYCPYYVNMDEVLDSMASSQKAVLLLKEGEVYEPLELKYRNKKDIETVPFSRAQTMIDMLHSCSAVDDGKSRVLVANLIAYDMWVDIALLLPSHFHITTLVLGPDMKINYCITKGNMLLKLPNGGIPIGYMHRLIKDLKISAVLHHENIEGNLLNTKFVNTDMQLVQNKLSSFGVTLDIGNVINTATHHNVALSETTVTVPPCIEYPLVRTVGSEWNGFKEKDREWHNVQMWVGKTLLGHYETLVSVLGEKSRSERTSILMKTFPSITDRKLLQAVIEEMPLQYGKDVLATWLRRVSYPTRYPFLDARVHKRKSEWVFSQVAVEKSLLYDVIHSAKAPRPIRTASPLLENQEEKPLPTPSNLSAVKRPDFMPSKYESLPSKWTQIKQYEWSSFKMAKMDKYQREFPVQMLEWIAQQLMVPVTFAEMQWMRNKKVTQALLYPDVMSIFMEDPSMFQHWCDAFGRKYSDGKQLMTKAYIPKSTKEHQPELMRMWASIHNKGTLWISDLDLYIFSKLVPCSILVLHRARYGEGNKKRGDITDLGVSSTFYTHDYSNDAVSMKPLVILYKTLQDDYAEYVPVVDSDGTFIHKSLLMSPKDVRELVSYHIENKTNRLK